MRIRSVVVALAATAILAGCADQDDPGPVSAPAAPSSGRPSTTAPPAGVPVSFESADGVALAGTLFGAGTTGVVLSNMGDNDPARWARSRRRSAAGAISC